MSLLELKHISKSFGGVKAVHHCSFSVEKGAVTSLIGPNGAGKTTLFNILCGFLKPDDGRVYFDGTDITRAPAWERSRLGLSRTFQESRSFYNLTLRENLLLSIRQDDDLFWRMIFRKKNIYEHDRVILEKMAFIGLKKSLDAKVTELSYGEQKLFDITRALLNPHKLLLMDEPVAGVNPVLRDELKEHFSRFRKNGETILLIEHDMDFVRSVSDRVIVLDQGSVLTEGNPHDVLQERKVLEAYLGVV